MSESSDYPEWKAADGSALGLLTVPFIFTQDRLLGTQDFIKTANERGIDLSLDELASLHKLGLFRPLLRVDDEQSAQHRIDRAHDDWSEVALYGERGQLRDPAQEVPASAPVHVRPEDASNDWWDGYYFSPWQLLALQDARNAARFVEWGQPLDEYQRAEQVARLRTLALCALAPRHYSIIWGQATMRDGRSFDAFHAAQYELTDGPRLKAAGFSAADLRPFAEQLLLRAHSMDPLIELWPLLRHSNYLGWKALKGTARLALDHRIAAELLLRAHEHMAEDGLLEPLPRLGRQGWHQALHDRLTVRDDSADGLDRALGRFGLSPHPRVLLLVEGETERIHVSRLLEEFGLDRPNQVRLHVARGSGKNPHMLAEYAVSPRLGPTLGNRRTLEATPTAIFVAMDPENLWSDEKRDRQRRAIQAAVREAVERQGGLIDQQELDILVQVFVWGKHSYELANFTNEQIIDALDHLAFEQGVERSDVAEWRREMDERLTTARASDLVDLDHVPGGFGFKFSKVRLAERLLPAVLAGLNPVSEDGTTHMPVVEMMLRVQALHAQLSGSGYTLRDSGERPLS